jgi:PAS domain S-box-containing protein
MRPAMGDETREVERRLIERKEIYRQILDAIADMVLVKGAGSRILWANKAFRDYYGMSNDQLRDLIDAPFNEADYTVQYMRDDRQVYITGEILNIPEEPVTRYDGLEQIFHTVKSPLLDEDDVVRMTVGVSRNITEQKHITEELSRYRESLEKLVVERTAELAGLSEQLQIVLSSISNGIVALNMDGAVQIMNEAAEAMTGWSSVEALDKPFLSLVSFEEEAPSKSDEPPYERWAKRGNVSKGVLRGRDQQARLVSISGAPLRGKSSVSGAVLVLRDITLEHEVEEQRLRQQKLESVGLLAGGIAHDFNNLLMGIMGSISVARLGLRSGEDPSEMLKQAEDACRQAQRLTTQLLTFARGGAPVKQVVHLDRVVREAAEFALHGSSAKLIFRSVDNVSPVEADEGQIVQVVNNLVQNARQAEPRDGQILVSLHELSVAEGEKPPLEAGRYVVIEVEDHGCGISPDNLPRVFDPYFTTKPESNGLGLASVHSIVHRHDGHVTVRSTEGLGTWFSVYLPVYLGGDQETPPVVDVGSKSEVRRVLVLDDELLVRRVLASMLDKLGHVTKVVGTSDEAFEEFRKARAAGTPFEWAIIDLTMPGDLDGATVIARLRAQDPALKVVVMSGYSVQPVMAKHRELDLKAALQKPFTFETLAASLKD